MKELKCYVVIVSSRFPKTHPKSGQYTHFRNRIVGGVKIHTIRHNYELWKKRIKEVRDGHAYISLREWTGKPYASKQREFKRLTIDDGVGIQKLQFTPGKTIAIDNYVGLTKIEDLARNDGLCLEDFKDWFADEMDMKPKAIIHFTSGRYFSKF